ATIERVRASPVFVFDRGRGAMVVHFCLPGVGGCAIATSIYTTRDRGRTWSPQTTLKQAPAQEAGFTDPDHGWLFYGPLGYLARTGDGGRVWSFFAPPGDLRPNSPYRSVLRFVD